MTTWTRLLAGALLAVGATASQSVAATLHFNDLGAYCDDPGGGLCSNNFEYQGFRFSPGNHWDVGQPSDEVSNDGTTWLGWDASGWSPNPQYLGGAAQSAVMYIDFHGRAFSALSFLGTLLASGDITVRSSKGGVLHFSNDDCAPVPNCQGGPAMRYLNGPEWRGITWLVLDVDNPGEPAGIDDLTLQAVPEPATLPLAAAALVLLGCGLRRRRDGRRGPDKNTSSAEDPDA